MRALLLASIFTVLSSVSGWGQGIDVVSRSQGASEGKGPADMIGATLSAIQVRLLAIKDQYRQLIEFGDARLGATRLDYEKGKMSWPDGKTGGPKFDVKDGCQLRVAISYPMAATPTLAAADQGGCYPYADLSYSFFLSSDPNNPAHDAFEKAVREIVNQESAKLAEQLCKLRLEEVCRTLRAQAGGEWEPGLHNGFLYGVLVVRGRLRNASGKTVADYHVLPIGTRVDRYGSRTLGMYGKAQGKVSIVGLGPCFNVVEFLRTREDDTVKKARGALTETLELSPPRITIEMYRPVLASAEGALERAQEKSFPDIAPVKRNSVAVGETPVIEERDGVLRFVWEMITSSKTGFRVVVERAKDGGISVLEVKLGL